MDKDLWATLGIFRDKRETCQDWPSAYILRDGRSAGSVGLACLVIWFLRTLIFNNG